MLGMTATTEPLHKSTDAAYKAEMALPALEVNQTISESMKVTISCQPNGERQLSIHHER